MALNSFIEQDLHCSIRHMVHLTVNSLHSNQQLDNPDFPLNYKQLRNNNFHIIDRPSFLHVPLSRFG